MTTTGMGMGTGMGTGMGMGMGMGTIITTERRGVRSPSGSHST